MERWIKMLKISCTEMKAMDTYAIDVIGIPSIVLMENAALKVVENIDFDEMQSFTVICAPGNNGGDGLAIARHLLLKDKKVDLFIVGDLDKATTDFRINLTILRNMGMDFTHITDANDLNTLENTLKENDLTIDAIFGIGLDRPVADLFHGVIERINQHSRKILAVDTPSGLDGDSGEALGISVRANQTICFHQMKKGLVNQEFYTGDITIVDIGIPKSVTETILAQS